MPEPNVIRFMVVPSPETNDHEVKIFIDGEEFIRRHWPNMMGMDPDQVLSYRHLSAQDEPHETTVLRWDAVKSDVVVLRYVSRPRVTT